MLEDSPNSISFATGGYIYMTFGLNTIKAYLDTLGDSSVQRNPSPAIDRSKFERRMTPSIRDRYACYDYGYFLYKRDETSGYLWIASSEDCSFRSRRPQEKAVMILF